MSHDFAPARGAAQHCPELTAQGLGRGPRPEDRAAALAAWRRELARALADDLSALLAGDRLDVSVSEPEGLTGEAALARIGPVAANSLLRAGSSGGTETALLSFDFATATALTDRSFGGAGSLPGTAPDHLPRSAALLVEEAATIIAQAIARVGSGDAADGTGGVIVRSESASRLKPFAPDAACLLFTLTIANRDGGEWRASLALAAERMDRLLPGSGASAPARPRSPATGTTAPFDAIPLPLHVVLAEVDLPLARLETLGPGVCIPLAMDRNVPLMVGDKVLAHGSIGTAEDRMAIRLTRIPVSAQGALR